VVKGRLLENRGQGVLEGEAQDGYYLCHSPTFCRSR
jgi:hypothetical protein